MASITIIILLITLSLYYIPDLSIWSVIKKNPNETPTNPKWNQMKSQWNPNEPQWTQINPNETQMKPKWNPMEPNEPQMKLKWNPNETQMKLKWNSNEIQMKQNDTKETRKVKI